MKKFFLTILLVLTTIFGLSAQASLNLNSFVHSVTPGQCRADGKIKITVAGNNKIKSLSIDDTLLEDKEALEDYLIVTINKAMDKVSDANKNAFGFINDMKLPFNL